eukprot:1637656-Rhodomonas_salina.1
MGDGLTVNGQRSRVKGRGALELRQQLQTAHHAAKVSHASVGGLGVGVLGLGVSSCGVRDTWSFNVGFGVGEEKEGEVQRLKEEVGRAREEGEREGRKEAADAREHVEALQYRASHSRSVC